MMTFSGRKIEKVGKSFLISKADISNAIPWEVEDNWGFSPAFRSVVRNIGIGGRANWWCEYDCERQTFLIMRVHYRVVRT
jgi:hypothetical protein